ncbi:riboflavin biosynthesis protein [Rutstroemia sp. NJR-2017a WRK4]|nr:riboflavin biosynthesis protein [Rutstroemia sp. NJR-2017a WRK4]
MASATVTTFQFPESERLKLEPYLPPSSPPPSRTHPHTTLTFASSLDSLLSLSPGTRTVLSGSASLAMTHYLRSRHDAILIGVNTAIADNPSLNCRLEGVAGYGGEIDDKLQGQPRPVIIDRRGLWDFGENSKVFKLAKEGRGKAPWIFTDRHAVTGERRRVLEEAGGRRYKWEKILGRLMEEGIQSVMVEGGAGIINGLLAGEDQKLVDGVIITIAPVWLGRGGVGVSPEREDQSKEVARLEGMKWIPLGDDVVCCGRIAG